MGAFSIIVRIIAERGRNKIMSTFSWSAAPCGQPREPHEYGQGAGVTSPLEAVPRAGGGRGAVMWTQPRPRGWRVGHFSAGRVPSDGGAARRGLSC